MKRQVLIRDQHSWWAWARLVLLGFLLSGLTSVMMVLPLLPTDLVTLDIGDVAGSDIRAPRRITYESTLLRAEEQDRAAASVAPVYTKPDSALARQQLDRTRQVIDYLGSVRADTLASSSRQRAWVVAVPELSSLSEESLNYILGLPDDCWNRVELEILAVIDQAMRKPIRESHVTEAYQELPALVSLDLSAEEAAATIALVESLLVPNSFLDPNATVDAQAHAREEISSVLRMFESGEIIVREGQRVTALEIEALDQFGLRQSEIKWQDFVSPGLLSLIVTTLLCWAG